MELLLGNFMKIYLLEKNYDYQAIDIIDTYYDNLLGRMNGVFSLKKDWKGSPYIKLINLRLKTTKDFNSITSERPVFSTKSLEILKEFFVSGEFLPLQDKKGKVFYLYNIFPEIDCLDINNPNLLWNMAKSAIFSDSKPTFLLDKIDRHIFKAKYMVTSVLVTDTFVQRVLDNKLKGFQFIPIWDSDTGYIEDIITNRIIT